jgi:hypothetical protein
MEKVFYLISKEAQYRIQGKQFEDTKKEQRNPKQIHLVTQISNTQISNF